MVVPFVVCRDCRTVYTYSHKDGTSSPVAHKCGMKSAGAGQGSISNFCRSDVSDAAYSAAKRKVTEAAVACTRIVKDLRPFRFIVGEGIGELAQALINIGADNKRRVDAAKCLPSDVTVAREVRRKAEQGRAALRLAKEMVTCAVTTNGWVDPHRHVSYVCRYTISTLPDISRPRYCLQGRWKWPTPRTTSSLRSRGCV